MKTNQDRDQDQDQGSVNVGYLLFTLKKELTGKKSCWDLSQVRHGIQAQCDFKVVFVKAKNTSWIENTDSYK